MTRAEMQRALADCTSADRDEDAPAEEPCSFCGGTGDDSFGENTGCVGCNGTGTVET